MKKEIAEVSIKLIEKDGKRILITANFGTLEDFAEITQILFENKLENARLISLLSSISQSIKTNLH
jgi:hypothetical protein